MTELRWQPPIFPAPDKAHLSFHMAQQVQGHCSAGGKMVSSQISKISY